MTDTSLNELYETRFSRRRLLYRGGSLAAATLGLAACGSSSAPKGAGGLSGKGGTVALTMWSHEGDVAKYLDKRAAELSSAAGARYHYKPIQLTTQPLQQMVPKVFSALTAHQPLPDILAVEINYFSRYMANDLADKVLVDVSPLLGDQMDGLYTTAATQPYTLDGKVYAIGVEYPLMAYYYRADLAAQLGIKFPIDTWEDMLDVGRKLARPKGKYLSTLATGKGGVGTAGISAQFINWLLQRGGTIFAEDGKTVTVDSPEAVDVMTFMVTALKDEVFLDVDAIMSPADVAAYKTGKVIGHEGADWWRFMITRNLQDQYGKWRLAEMPRFAGGGAPTATWGGTGYAISKQSKNQAAAWNLLRNALITPAGERANFQQLSFLPVLKSSYQDPFFVDYKDTVLGGQKKFELYAKLAPEAHAQPQSAYWQFALQALDRAVASAFHGTAPAKAVKTAATEIQNNIKQAG